MTRPRTRTDHPGPREFRRPALAPGVLAAAVALAGLPLVGTETFMPIRYVLAVLALIIAWFAVEVRHWWWLPIPLVIAVLWNPVFPFAFDGLWGFAAQYLAALGCLIVAGLLNVTPRAASGEGTRGAP